MNSALTPREIQSRIRAGESVDDVARAAGVSVDELGGFVEPVLAEREHMTEMARAAQARRDNGPIPQPLEQFVTTRLRREGVPDGAIAWDAFRREDQTDRHWTIRITYRLESTSHQALFDFDPRGRYAVAENADARWLINDQPQSRTPRTTRNPDAEPTIDLNDELAIVRAVQDDETPVIGDGTALQELYEAAASNDATSTGSGTDRDGLREVDGVYDIVPNPTSDMDVLYDMLAGFDEDSVHVYEGLSRPISLGESNTLPSDEPKPEPTAAESTTSEPGATESAEPGKAQREPARGDSPADAEPPATQPTRSRATKTRTARAASAKTPAPGSHAAKGSAAKGSRTVTNRKGSTAARKSTPAGKAKPTDEPSTAPAPEQDPLVDDDSSTTRPTPAKKSTRRRKSHRATVPSWDEIMFGERHPDES